jgi:hypothetical protein
LLRFYLKQYQTVLVCVFFNTQDLQNKSQKDEEAKKKDTQADKK